MSWVLRGNVSARWALVATVVTWVAIPVLWTVNEWGALSLAELFWLLLVVAAWLLALAGLFLGREQVLAVVVFALSTVIPLVLLSVVLLLIVLTTGGDAPID